jgi:hypothetical protein
MSLLGSIVQQAGAGGATEAQAAQIIQNEENIAINSINRLIDNGFAFQNMVDAVADAYSDTTGVNTGSTTAVYDAAGNYYQSYDASPDFLVVSNDSPNGSTTFVDYSANEFTINALGDAQHSTAQAKFGTSSIYFDGTGDGLYVNDQDNWHFTGDLTVDFFVRLDDVSGTKILIGQDGISSQRSWVIYSTGSNLGVGYTASAGSMAFATSASNPLSANTWHHIALVRSGSDLKGYVDGAEVLSVSFGSAFANSTAQLTVGFNGTTGAPNSPMNGYIDNIRIINGTAVWTSSFTPPSSSYSPGNSILVSTSFAAQENATTAKIVAIMMINDATLNTDVVARLSNDGGTTTDDVVLEERGTYTGDLKIVSCDPVTLSGSGSSIVYELESFNEKLYEIHAIWVQWG